MNRNEFLKKFKISNKISSENSDSFQCKTGLSDDKLEFIQKYVLWLEDFKLLVHSRKENQFDIEHNKKIMDLAAEIERHKPKLEKYMNDPIFKAHFSYLTKDITDVI